MMLVEEVVADVDVAAEVAAKAQAKADTPDQSEVNKVTWLQANKYYTAKE
jgi:hypothetical protein